MEALGLGSTATQAEIKKAYHKQAREHHPDKGGEELKFKQISNAYAYLSDSSPKPDAPIQSDTRQQGSSNTNSPPPRGPTTQSDARQAPPRTNTSGNKVHQTHILHHRLEAIQQLIQVEEELRKPATRRLCTNKAPFI